MKTFLRWAGSKKQLLPILRPLVIPLSGRYIEPFAGSACVFFDTTPTQAILGDLNWELISTYKALRKNVEGVIVELKKLRRGKEAYYRIRRSDPMQLSLEQVAARFIYLNHFCFNGLYRTNLDGKFNVPFGHNKSEVGFGFENLRHSATLLRRVELINGDFETTISSARSGDLVYLDPPYFVTNRRIFREYSSRSFQKGDLDRLALSLRMLDRNGVRFVLSYADCVKAKSLFSSWRIRRVRVRRNIAGFSGSRRGVYELLVCNFDQEHP